MKQARRVVLIMTDTQRKDMLGCYGNPDMKTPNLDRLAGEGLRFENAYCCQPVCGPARAGLFTGQFPHSNGSWGNSMVLDANTKTIGQRLHDKGVHTAYIGKWHLDGGDYFGMGRCPDGWDSKYWYDMRNYLEELTEEDRLRSRQTKSNEDEDMNADFTFGHRCSNRAIDFLEQHSDEDFFLVVSYDEPHGPFVCPRPYSQLYKDYRWPNSPNVWDTLEHKPEHQRAWAGERIHQNRDDVQLTPQYFLGCNSFVDSEIGRVLDAIDSHAPDALVIYTADHGHLFENHCLDSKGAAMYEEITNVPFLVRWPQQAPTGIVSDQLVSHIDVAPTIMDIMGLSIPQILEGRSLASAFAAPETPANEHIFMEFNRYEIDHDSFGGFQPIRAVFDGRYKLVINLLSSDELYDLEHDGQEMNNLIDSEEHEALRNALHDAILNWMNETRDPFRGYYWERRPWREDARPATWDYTGMTRQRVHPEYEPQQLDYDTGLPIREAVRKKKL